MKTHYPKQRDTLRRFRLFDGKTSKQIRHHYYRWHHNSHDGATIMMRWAKVGETIEVVDIKRGALLAQYTRHAGGITIHREPTDRGYA
jgi:hypothetical protein